MLIKPTPNPSRMHSEIDVKKYSSCLIFDRTCLPSLRSNKKTKRPGKKRKGMSKKLKVNWILRLKVHLRLIQRMRLSQKLTFWPGYIRTHIGVLRTLRPASYTDFRSKSSQHSGLAWGAIFQKIPSMHDFQRQRGHISGTCSKNGSCPECSLENHYSQVPRTPTYLDIQYFQDPGTSSQADIQFAIWPSGNSQIFPNISRLAVGHFPNIS